MTPGPELPAIADDADALKMLGAQKTVDVHIGAVAAAVTCAPIESWSQPAHPHAGTRT